MFRACLRLAASVVRRQRILPAASANFTQFYAINKNSCVESSRFFCANAEARKNVDDWIKSLNDDEQKLVRLIQNELAVKYVQNEKVPQVESLDEYDYREMMVMSRSRRHTYYSFLFKKKTSEENDRIKQMLRRHIMEDRRKEKMLSGTEPQTDHIEYGLAKNAMYVKIYRRTIMMWKHRKLIASIYLKEPSIIFDCGFCHTMTKREMEETADQIKYSFTANRNSRRPFNMHLCNLSSEDLLYKCVHRIMRNIDELPFKVHEKELTEVFPVDKLIYLTPDSENALEKFEPGMNYVVGSIVDLGESKPLTLAKAKKLGIRTARLPIDQYLRFRSHKSLTLDQMTKILVEFKLTGDWRLAFRHIPRRKYF